MAIAFYFLIQEPQQKRRNIAGKIPVVDHTQSTRGCMRRNVDTGEYAASSLVRKYHDHYYTTKDRSLSVNNTENEKYNAFFYLTDCSPYEDRSNRSLTSLLSGLLCYDRNAWPKT